MNIIRALFLSIFFVASVKCAKILGIFPSPGYSQFILAERLIIELARRGHEVTVISPFKLKEDIRNYRAILVDDLLHVGAGDLYQQENENLFNSILFLDGFGLMLTEYILAHEQVQRLIHSNETFDLVLLEHFTNDAHFGFASHFNAPLVTFHSMGLSDLSSHLVGNVRLPSVNPFAFSPYTDKMSFFQRLHNAILIWFEIAYRELVTFPNHQKLLTKYFPKEIILKDVLYNSSVMLLNSHSSTTYPSTLTASVIEIGGFHISPKKLPNDIQKFLDEATEGAIFFSMGSNLNSSDLPRPQLEGILKAFSKLKQKVLWKFESPEIPSKPKNVFISKWLPQSDILAHPNTVAFITHGGLLSTTESIHYGVPTIGIPIFGDQKMNVAQSVQKQIAVRVPFKDLSEESLTAALNEVLKNSKYSRNAKAFSNSLKDQVIKPLDLAMFWIEYVMRHGGAPIHRNATIELYWFQLYLVDVVCFLILSVVVLYFAIKLLIRRIFRRIAVSRKANSKQKLN